jgi:hypothetical protein
MLAPDTIVKAAGQLEFRDRLNQTHPDFSVKTTIIGRRLPNLPTVLRPAVGQGLVSFDCDSPTVIRIGEAENLS